MMGVCDRCVGMKQKRVHLWCDFLGGRFWGVQGRYRQVGLGCCWEMEMGLRGVPLCSPPICSTLGSLAGTLLVGFPLSTEPSHTWPDPDEAEI